MKVTAPVRIEVAFKNSGEQATFRFSRTWTVPRLILRLPAGRMGLLNVSFLAAEEKTAIEDRVVGLPVLGQIVIDSRTLLEHNWTKLDGTDCGNVEVSLDRSPVARPSRLMITCKLTDDIISNICPQFPTFLC